MIQDAYPMRGGLPDGYVAHYKLDVTAGPAYTLDMRRLPSGFTATRNAAGLIDVTFPSCFAVRWYGGGVDNKTNVVGVTNQVDVYPVNINPSAGTMQVRITDHNNPPAAVDAAVGGEIHFSFALEAL